MLLHVKAHSPKLQLILEAARKRFREGRGIPHETFWKEVEAEHASKARTILVDEADADSLVGMRLLRGHELRMQVRHRGKVTIKRLPRKQN